MQSKTTLKKLLKQSLSNYQTVYYYSDRRKIGSRIKIATVKYVDDEQLSAIKLLSDNILSIDRMVGKGRQSTLYWFTISLNCMQSEVTLKQK